MDLLGFINILYRFFCIHYDSPSDYNNFICQESIKIWVSKLNVLSKRYMLIFRFEELEEETLNPNKKVLTDCKDKKLQPFLNLITNLAYFQVYSLKKKNGYEYGIFWGREEEGGEGEGGRGVKNNIEGEVWAIDKFSLRMIHLSFNRMMPAFF